ncbi:MAG: prephenate dehydratase [Candidatus Mycalebacterium zealandia]|nr:MAG: prephenate dehydratase [Candidatus Mycalebacterium zealandia]
MSRRAGKNASPLPLFVSTRILKRFLTRFSTSEMPVKRVRKSGSKTLSKLRAEIDSVDRKIFAAINERAAVAFEVMEEKKRLAKSVYDPEREREVEKKIVSLNKGPLADGDALSIFRQIIRSCRTLQSKGRVSYLGPEGSFSHQAASNMFGYSSEMVPRKTIEEVFESVATGSVSMGAIPIENSTEGSVGRVLEIIAENDFHITREHYEKISHLLLSKTGSLKDLKKIASHPQALGQCRKWIALKLPAARPVETSSTAAAAVMAAKDKTVGAISSAHSASIYKLRIAAKSVEDTPLNATRFVVVEKAIATQKRDGNKISIMFSIKDEPGALHKTLFSPLASAGVNLTRIESRPSGKKAWEYVFFVDLEGSLGKRKTDKLIREIESGSSSFKVLGCYFSGDETRADS